MVVLMTTMAVLLRLGADKLMMITAVIAMLLVGGGKGLRGGFPAAAARGSIAVTSTAAAVSLLPRVQQT